MTGRVDEGARVSYGTRIGDTLRVPGRGLRRTLVVLVVLAIAATSGVTLALAAPQVVDRLGLGGAAAQRVPAVPRPVLHALDPAAPVPSTAGLAAELDTAAADMPGRFTGVVVDPVSGRTLWEHTANDVLVPGSTGKLLTAAAALLTLDATDSFVTKVVPGPDPSTVVLVGGGDPTLSTLPAGQQSVYPNAPKIADLAAKVKEATQGRQITTVLIDTQRYTGPELADGWLTADIRGGYITPIRSLMADGGRTDPTEQDGPRVDEPALAAGQAFADAIGATTVKEGAAPQGAKAIAAASSAPIGQLVEHLLRTSDNVLAEMLAREVAIARGGEPSFAGAAAQVSAALAQAGLDPSGAVLADGSGLSTDDRVPARLLGAVLAAAAAPAQGPQDTQMLRPMLTGLPVAGGDGTLDDRYARVGESAAGRGVVRAKTGTLTGVSSLAGTVTDEDGALLVFAFMSNGASPVASRPLLDEMAAALSGCGCR